MPSKKTKPGAVGSAATGRAARKSSGSGVAASRERSAGKSRGNSKHAVGAPPRAPASRLTRASAAAQADPKAAALGLMDLTRLGSQPRGAATPPRREESPSLPGAHGSAGKRTSTGRLQQAGSYSRMANAGGAPSLPGFSLTAAGDSTQGTAREGGGAEPAPGRRNSVRAAAGRGAAAVTAPVAPPAGSDHSPASATPSMAASSGGLGTGKRQQDREQQQQQQQQQQSAPVAQPKKKRRPAGKATENRATPRAAGGKSKAVKEVTDADFQAWEYRHVTYTEEEKNALFIAALQHGSSFHSTQWSYNNSVGKNSWLEHVAKPAVSLLSKNGVYKQRLAKLNVDPQSWMKDLFLSEQGVMKIRKWFKSQKNQANEYHKSHGQTGSSGGKIESKQVELRQQLYSTNPAVVKGNMRESRLPPVVGGAAQEQPEDGVDPSPCWQDYGVNPVVDTRDGGANLETILDVEDETGTGADGGNSWDDDDGEGEEDEEDPRSFEETTNGGGSSRAGLPVASGGGAAGGDGSGRLSGGRVGGGVGSSSPAASATSPRSQGNARGKGKAKTVSRHQKKGTHDDLDDELMQDKTSSRAAPPKRNTHWQPPGEKKGIPGMLEEESKDRKAKNAMLARLVQSHTDKKSSGASEEELKLRREELEERKRQKNLDSLKAFEGVFSKSRMKKAVPLLLPPKVRAALLGNSDDDDDLYG